MEPADTNQQPGPAQDTSQAPIEQWDERRCGREKGDGTPCRAYRVKGREACAGHLGLGIASDPEGYAALSAVSRQEQAAVRKLTTLDAIRVMLDEDATLVALRKARDSEDPSIALRAVQLMLDRVHGKAKETIQTLERPAELAAVASMTREERDGLWRRLMAEETRLNA